MENKNLRKIIKFGSSSSVITLPSKWLSEQSLQNGDRIGIYSNNDTLVLVKPSEKKVKDVEVCCDVPFKIFNKTLVSFYLKNYDKITITGKDLFTKLEQIKLLKDKLPSLEIMSVDRDKIILRDLVSVENLEVENLVNEMMDVCSVMFDELLLLEQDTSKHFLINSLDNNLNRISFLIYKSLNHNLHSLKSHTQTKNTILYWRMASSLEHLGDILKRVARYLSSAQKETIQTLTEQLKSLKDYFLFITCLFQKELNLRNNLEVYLDKKQSLLKSLEQARDKHFTRYADLFCILPII